jgi:hypothetical protein
MELLEAEHLVGPAEGLGTRAVLADADDDEP